MASSNSNEEIIENLTKGLGKTCIKSETDGSSPGSSHQKLDDDGNSVENNCFSSDDEVEVEKPTSPVEKDEDFIDEDSLKDRDAQLSSEEKEVGITSKSVNFRISL